VKFRSLTAILPSAAISLCNYLAWRQARFMLR
jgi:hypothetical protein